MPLIDSVKDRERALLTLAGQITPDCVWAVYRQLHFDHGSTEDDMKEALLSTDSTLVRGSILLLSESNKPVDPSDHFLIDHLIQLSTTADPSTLSVIARMMTRLPADHFAEEVHTSLLGTGDARSRAMRLLELVALNPDPAADAVDPYSAQNDPPALTFIGGGVRKLILNSPTTDNLSGNSPLSRLRNRTATWVLEPWHSSTGPVTRAVAVQIVRQANGSGDPHVFYLGDSVTVDPTIPWLPMGTTTTGPSITAAVGHFGGHQYPLLITLSLSMILGLITVSYLSLREE